jgi:hypothetical protein
MPLVELSIAGIQQYDRDGRMYTPAGRSMVRIDHRWSANLRQLVPDTVALIRRTWHRLRGGSGAR